MRRLPGPAVRRLSEGNRTPEALFELFQDWQRTQTQSSVTALWSPRLRMDVRFCARQEPLPRGIECTLRVLQSLYRALSRAPQEDPCLLLTKTYMEVGYAWKCDGPALSVRHIRA